jgi:SSS family solute:Na+ symporter
VVDVIVSIIVSMFTEPKPESELRGLVYSETPKEELRDPQEATMPWYRRTVPLACISLALVIVLNILI